MRALLAAMAVVAGGVSAWGQPASASARTMLAAVVDQQGRPVVDLGLDDFVVSEGGAPRDVLDVHVADYPLALILDDRAESRPTFDAIRNAAQRFTQRVGERPVALVRLTDGGHLVAGLSDDRETVRTRIATLTPGGDVNTPPLDTIAATASLLKGSGAPFSAVVVIAGGPVDASALVRGELLPQILDSGAAVHVVQLGAGGVVAGGVVDADLLRVVADQSHGQFTTVYSGASMPAALDRLADRLAIELMVQYLVPPGPREGDAKVGVRLPGARVVGLGVR